jgi:hypothetical protein
VRPSGSRLPNATTAADGKPCRVEYFNLDAILSVGYRVNSERGTQLRIRATATLHDHLLGGYTLNERRRQKAPPVREVLCVAEHADGWGVPADWDGPPSRSEACSPPPERGSLRRVDGLLGGRKLRRGRDAGHVSGPTPAGRDRGHSAGRADPANAEVHHRLGLLYAQASLAARARTALRKALELDPARTGAGVALAQLEGVKGGQRP